MLSVHMTLLGFAKKPKTPKEKNALRNLTRSWVALYNCELVHSCRILHNLVLCIPHDLSMIIAAYTIVGFSTGVSVRGFVCNYAEFCLTLCYLVRFKNLLSNLIRVCVQLYETLHLFCVIYLFGIDFG